MHVPKWFLKRFQTLPTTFSGPPYRASFSSRGSLLEAIHICSFSSGAGWPSSKPQRRPWHQAHGSPFWNRLQTPTWEGLWSWRGPGCRRWCRLDDGQGFPAPRTNPRDPARGTNEDPWGGVDGDGKTRILHDAKMLRRRRRQNEETPTISDVRSAQKPCIKNPSVESGGK
jgi:hypothetical protein